MIRKLLNPKILVLLLALFPTIWVVSRFVPIHRNFAFADCFRQPSMDKKEMLAVFEKCIFECPEEDASFAKKYYDIFSNAQDFKQLFLAARDMFIEFLDQQKGELNLETSLLYYSEALNLLSTLRDFKVENPDFRDRILVDIDKLPSRFLESAGAHRLNGEALSLFGSVSQNEETIEAFKNCLELEPKESFCKSAYEYWVAEYSKVRCLKEDIAKDVGIFLASDAKVRRLEKTSEFEKMPIYLENKPSLTAQDIQAIEPKKGLFDEEALLVILTIEGQNKLTTITRENSRMKLAMMAHGNVLSAAMIDGENSTGIFELSPGKKTLMDGPFIEEVCDKTTASKLPERLLL